MELKALLPLSSVDEDLDPLYELQNLRVKPSRVLLDVKGEVGVIKITS
jgi:hypothetical protein